MNNKLKSQKNITTSEAYLVMYEFLSSRWRADKEYYLRLDFDGVGNICSGLALVHAKDFEASPHIPKGGVPFDIAFVDDWHEALRRVLGEKRNVLSVYEAYEVMRTFLHIYNEIGLIKEVEYILKELPELKGGEIPDNNIAREWMGVVKLVKEGKISPWATIEGKELFMKDDKSNS